MANIHVFVLFFHDAFMFFLSSSSDDPKNNRPVTLFWGWLIRALIIVRLRIEQSAEICMSTCDRHQLASACTCHTEAEVFQIIFIFRAAEI